MSEVEAVVVADVVFGIEVTLDDSDDPAKALPDRDGKLELLPEPVLRVIRSVPGVNENVYAVNGQPGLTVEFDVTEDEADSWLVLVADPVFKVVRSVPGVNENCRSRYRQNCLYAVRTAWQQKSLCTY